MQICFFLLASVAVAALAVLPPVTTTVDATTRDGRQNKKTKWDKVLFLNTCDAIKTLMDSGMLNITSMFFFPAGRWRYKELNTLWRT